MFDFSLISAPEFTSDSLKLNMNGYFYPVGKSSKVCNPIYNFEPIRENEDSKIFISKKSLYFLAKSIIS